MLPPPTSSPDAVACPAVQRDGAEAVWLAGSGVAVCAAVGDRARCGTERLGDSALDELARGQLRSIFEQAGFLPLDAVPPLGVRTPPVGVDGGGQSAPSEPTRDGVVWSGVQCPDCLCSYRSPICCSHCCSSATALDTRRIISHTFLLTAFSISRLWASSTMGSIEPKAWAIVTGSLSIAQRMLCSSPLSMVAVCALAL